MPSWMHSSDLDTNSAALPTTCFTDQRIEAYGTNSIPNRDALDRANMVQLISSKKQDAISSYKQCRQSCSNILLIFLDTTNERSNPF